MQRRKFLINSSLAGLSITVSRFISCTTSPIKQTATGDQFALAEATINQLQEKMKANALTSKAITQMYLDRIRDIDKNGPALNSVIELNPDALAIADAMDKERKDGKIRGPLHGIPVLIKDNIDTADKMMTTAGSLALASHIAAKDAFIVKRLRESGAVIIGKTNLSEWANFRSTRSSSGWSSRGGQTKNPYILDRSPCGSSSGSGTAVAANLCAIAIGTETNGSIACPASIGGVVGIKPTVGLWSRSGIIPISSTQDTAGPMARTVEDAAILLSVLAGIDPNDTVTANSKEKSQDNYARFLDANALSGKRIGVEKSFLNGHEAVDALLQKALEQLRSKGATIVEVELIKLLKTLRNEEFKILKYEFKDGLNKYLSTANDSIKTLKDIIAFNKKNESKVMPYFKQEIMDSSQALGDLQTKEYTDALKRLLDTTRGSINKILQDNQLQAICGPANGPSWCIDLINGDAGSGYGMYSSAAIAGYPSITVPMGDVDGLPVGLSFIGTAFSEPELISIAYAYEQVSKNRKPPGFLKSFAG